MLTQLKG